MFWFVFVEAIRNNVVGVAIRNYVVGVGEIVFAIFLLKKVNYFLTNDPQFHQF